MSAPGIMKAAEISARISWPDILRKLGIGPEFLKKRHGPCPRCGGKDRYKFDNKFGRGDFFCNQCGAGTGFDLLMLVHGWDFKQARREVIQAAGLQGAAVGEPAPRKPALSVIRSPEPPSKPPRRVTQLRRELCAVEALDDPVSYLESRGLFPLPAGHALKAHASAEYWHEGERVGRFPALVGEVRNAAGELVTTHVTYLQGGRKLSTHEPRKILSPLTGHTGCAVRLMRLDGDALGIAEGIETALSAARLHSVPVWAALNATLLGRFEPPTSVKRLVIFADRDVAGLDAASRLMERLQGRVQLEVKAPRTPHKDWNDAYMADGCLRR